MLAKMVLYKILSFLPNDLNLYYHDKLLRTYCMCSLPSYFLLVINEIFARLGSTYSTLFPAAFGIRVPCQDIEIPLLIPELALDGVSSVEPTINASQGKCLNLLKFLVW